MELVNELAADAVDHEDRELLARVIDGAHREEVRVKVLVDDDIGLAHELLIFHLLNRDFLKDRFQLVFKRICKVFANH